MRVGSSKGFGYCSVKLVLLADGNGHLVNSSKFFFFMGKAVHNLKDCLVATLTFFDAHHISVVCGLFDCLCILSPRRNNNCLSLLKMLKI
jgi:hypothetical protein